MAKRQTFAVTLTDLATGEQIASTTRYAMNSGRAASEGLVRDLARSEGTRYSGAAPEARTRNSSEPYVRRWESDVTTRVVVARVALIEPGQRSNSIENGRMTVQASELRSGDHVTIGDRRPLVRTVSHVTDSGAVNARGVAILTVHYAEGQTAEWGPGNTWAADSPVDIDRPAVRPRADCPGCGRTFVLDSSTGEVVEHLRCGTGQRCEPVALARS